MESLGATFKNARERKRVSLSQAAAKTRIKVQILEGLERNDFSQIPAPTYARGFIKMYAEFLGLDPAPLAKMYAELQAPAAPKGKGERAAAVAPAPEPAPVEEATKRTEGAHGTSAPPMSWKLPAALVGSLLAVIIIAAGVSRCSSGDKEKPVKTVTAPPAAPAPKRNPLALIQEPPEPYIQVAGVTNSP